MLFEAQTSFQITTTTGIADDQLAEQTLRHDHKNTDASQCSTIKYSEYQESYATFIPKAKNLFIRLFPERSAETFTITRIKGGAYNRILGLEIVPAELRKYTLPWFRRYMITVLGNCIPQQPSKYILRAPRNADRDPLDLEYDVAAIIYAYRTLKLPVPKVESYDSRADSVLGQQYMIQQWLPGRNLDSVWKDSSLSTKQRRSLIREFIQISRSLQAVTSDRPGTINPSTISSPSSTLSLDKFETKYRRSPRLCIPAIPQTTIEFLLETVTRWEEYDRNEDEDDFVLPQWSQLRKLFTHLHTRGFLPDDDVFYFCHLDLAGRNVLSSSSPKSATVTGLLDWDSEYVKFCPKFMAYQAPFWMWVEDEKQEDDEAFCAYEPESEDKKSLKRYWESLAGEEWCKYAFRKEYEIARRAFSVLQFGFFNSWFDTELQEIVGDWQKLYPDDDLEKDFEFSDDESEDCDSIDDSEGSDSNEDEVCSHIEDN
jgi:hypothetical protein